MKEVFKYNLYKGISTLLTVGTPLITLMCCGEMFVHRADTAISAAGVFAILLTILLLKDKIAENFKMPSAFVICLVGLVIVTMIENIIQPIKVVFTITLITSGVDLITFRRMYKSLEILLPDEAKAFKHFGFILTSTDNLKSIVKDK